MNNVDLIIKQELLPPEPLQNEDETSEDNRADDAKTSSGSGNERQENPSPVHSVTSNSSSSNHGGSHTEEKFLLSALLTGNLVPNRKRKSPPIKTASFSSKDSETDEDLEANFASKMLKDLASKRQSPTEAQDHNESKSNNDHPLLKSYLSSDKKLLYPRDFSVMSEERMRMQQINSIPRNLCPICGDKANGLHYGIYSCEGCKNFFKRSVLVCQDRPYVCKFDGRCSVSVTEIDGVKQKGPRCQACRYQACLDAGMYHSGVQRSRGGRHVSSALGSSPSKKSSSSQDDKSWQKSIFGGFVARLKANRDAAAALNSSSNNFPQMQLPDIGARLQAAHIQNLLQTPAEKTNGHQGEEYTNGDDHEGENGVADPLDEDYLARYRTEHLIAEVKLLRSKNRELTMSNTEKDKQIKLYQRQLSIVKRALVMAKRKKSESLRRSSVEIDPNPTLKALLTADGDHPLPKPNGSLTLTPVIRKSDEQHHEEDEDDEMPDAPLEPTVIIKTESSDE